MKWSMGWDAGAVAPGVETVARSMGFPDATAMSPRVAALVEAASAAFARLAAPRGVARLVDRETFARVYAGAGRNDPRTPLAGIHPRADALALFVGTLGEAVSREIAEAFAGRDPALAYVLDTVASEAADTVATRIAAQVADRVGARGAAGAPAVALPYSPGYCGWHVSGQAALFAALEPAPETGVTLNDSCLMQPLKSVSGVVVVAPREAHAIVTDFDCCDVCTTRHCQDRLAGL